MTSDQNFGVVAHDNSWQVQDDSSMILEKLEGDRKEQDFEPNKQSKKPPKPTPSPPTKQKNPNVLASLVYISGSQKASRLLTHRLSFLGEIKDWVLAITPTQSEYQKWILYLVGL